MSEKKELSVVDIINNLEKKNFGRNLFLFVMGMFISAFAVNLFFEPYNVIPTGSSGLALLIAKFSNIDLSLVTFIVSVIIYLLGILIFGWEYSFKLLAVTILYPAFL